MSIAKRLKGITKIAPEYRTTIPPAPKSVKIEIVSSCNYRCQYCALTSRKGHPNKDMDWGLFKRITKEMKEIGVEEIGVFYIGESFMTPDLLVECIKYLKGELKMPYVFLTSNGSLANPTSVERCMKAGLDSLKWSCNSADKKQFKELMGVNEEIFDVALNNIKSAWEIRKKGYKTGLYASSIKYNDEQINRMKPLVDERIKPYVDEYYWLPLYSASGDARDRIDKLGIKPIAGNTGRLDDPSEPLPCWTAFTEGHVLFDGRMSACCLDGMGKLVMGDLTKQSFMEIWHSDEYKKLRKVHLEKNIIGTKCEKCILAEG